MMCQTMWRLYKVIVRPLAPCSLCNGHLDYLNACEEGQGFLDLQGRNYSRSKFKGMQAEPCLRGWQVLLSLISTSVCLCFQQTVNGTISKEINFTVSNFTPLPNRWVGRQAGSFLIPPALGLSCSSSPPPGSGYSVQPYSLEYLISFSPFYLFTRFEKPFYGFLQPVFVKIHLTMVRFVKDLKTASLISLFHLHPSSQQKGFHRLYCKNNAEFTPPVISWPLSTGVF